METENGNLFAKYSSFVDDDEDFEVGELENFDIDKIAPKPSGFQDLSSESLLDEEDLLQQAEILKTNFNL
ncbi:MAG: hypothetical protein IIU03_13750 [Bacteroidales bacterium]|jgi:hypothetical protein|nr:hypothetical protein [Bacteroidales bacterium]MBQ5541290.1 hypothetical protein [Bacteroidales bacterium]MBR4677101.1 hypothetical protein [Bacteroidales bacterium]